MTSLRNEDISDGGVASSGFIHQVSSSTSCDPGALPGYFVFMGLLFHRNGQLCRRWRDHPAIGKPIVHKKALLDHQALFVVLDLPRP